MHLITLFKSENQLKGSGRRKGRTTVEEGLVWWAYRLCCQKADRLLIFHGEGNLPSWLFCLMTPKEKPYSTRKGRWGLEGWYCKWWLKRKEVIKQEKEWVVTEIRISQNREYWWWKSSGIPLGKNGITKSGNLSLKRKKKTEILWGSFEKDPAEKKKKLTPEKAQTSKS